MFFINTNVINWWPLSTGINGSSFLESVAETKAAVSGSGIFMTSGGLMCGCDVSCYHGDSRHMFRTSTRGGSDADKSRHAKVHAQTHACPHIHIHTPRASGTGNCQEESESTFSSFSGSFHSETALWRLKYIQSYPLKKYSLLYSHQPLCLLFISALLMFIFIAISDTSLSVLFQSVSKVKFSPSKPSSPKIFQTPTHLFFTFIFIFMALNSILYTWARGYCVYMRSEILMKKKREWNKTHNVLLFHCTKGVIWLHSTHKQWLNNILKDCF